MHRLILAASRNRCRTRNFTTAVGDISSAISKLEAQDQPADYGSYTRLLKSCTNPEQGRRIHSQITKHGLLAIPNVILCNHLLNMYARLGNETEAKSLFDQMPNRNLYSWTALIAAFARKGNFKSTLKLLQEMQVLGISLDDVAFLNSLSACSSPQSLSAGLEIHRMIIWSRLDSDLKICNALINMYKNCGCITQAQQVFDRMRERNLISWTTIISAHANNGHVRESLRLFRFMLHLGFHPNKYSIITILNACSSPGSLWDARMIHTCVSDSGLGLLLLIQNTIISMYGRCGDVDRAREAFDLAREKSCIVSWNAIFTAYAHNNRFQDAQELYQQMPIPGDKVTFISLLGCCTKPEDLLLGKQLHKRVQEINEDSDPIVRNSLITMYSKCGAPADARAIFDGMNGDRTVISWTTIISDCVRRRMISEAFDLFHQMQKQQHLKLDSVAFTTILGACAEFSAIEQGRKVYLLACNRGLGFHLGVQISLINLYGRCADLDSARGIFNRLVDQVDRVEFWNTMLGAYAQLGHTPQAIFLFRMMEAEGIKPDSHSFRLVLLACSHSGLVSVAKGYFTSMREYPSARTSVHHFGCVIDLLGRGGRLAEAEEMLDRLPVKPDLIALSSLLAACRNHRDLKRAKSVARRMLELEPRCSSGYVAMSNIYAEAKNWQAVARVRKFMAEQGVEKEAGLSWIETGGRVHEFLCGDRRHEMTEMIYEEIDRLHEEIRKAGYVPDTRLVMHFVGEEEKERLLFSHSERLAVALGMISSGAGEMLRVTKNLRVCGDCHTAMKSMAAVTKRVIVVRDCNRFHLFSEGKCSCQDYW